MCDVGTDHPARRTHAERGVVVESVRRRTPFERVSHRGDLQDDRRKAITVYVICFRTGGRIVNDKYRVITIIIITKEGCRTPHS